MGGRGASSGGRRGRAPRGYRTVGKVRGISIIRDNVKGKGLPTKARANSLYFGTDKSGRVNQLRLYGKNGNAIKDFDWTHSFEGHAPGTVHKHRWDGTNRLFKHFPLSKTEILKYKTIIEKATGRRDLIWTW